MLVHEISGADQGIDARYVTRGSGGMPPNVFGVSCSERASSAV